MKPSRIDTSTPATLDLSPEIMAARVKRLGQVRRTALAAAGIRDSLAKKHGRAKS